jgi:hypothetical protein
MHTNNNNNTNVKLQPTNNVNVKLQLLSVWTVSFFFSPNGIDCVICISTQHQQRHHANPGTAVRLWGGHCCFPKAGLIEHQQPLPDCFDSTRLDITQRTIYGAQRSSRTSFCFDRGSIITVQFGKRSLAIFHRVIDDSIVLIPSVSCSLECKALGCCFDNVLLFGSD